MPSAQATNDFVDLGSEDLKSGRNLGDSGAPNVDELESGTKLGQTATSVNAMTDTISCMVTHVSPRNIFPCHALDIYGVCQ